MTSAPPEVLFVDHHPSPVGEILLVTDEGGALRALDFTDYEPRMRRLLRLHYGEPLLVSGAAPAAIHQALDAYFAKDHSALDGIIIRTGGAAFQRLVWRALKDIQPGETLSYGALAQSIGRPKAVRAVGLANGANPVGIVVPCHRVIGANGALTGYGGGMERKLWLLRHEGAAAV